MGQPAGRPTEASRASFALDVGAIGRRLSVITLVSVVLSWLACEAAYVLLDLRLDPGAPSLFAHCAPALIPLVVAPLVTVSGAVLTQRLEATNQELRQEIRLREKLQAELEHQARHDPLTGLLNRRGFFERAHDALGGGGLLLIIDLDRFKQINDQHGHAAGDAVLVAVARAVADLAGTADPGSGEVLVARLGGDEFVLILPSGADVVAVAIRDRLKAVTVPLAHGVTITTSGTVGITSVSEQDSIDEALAAGDSRMYRQKSRSAAGVPAH